MTSTFLLLLAVVGPVEAKTAEGPPIDLPLEDLLAEHATLVEPEELLASSGERAWMLEVLRRGFAHTPTLERRLARVPGPAGSAVAYLQRAAPTWSERLARYRRAAPRRHGHARMASRQRGVTYDIPLADHPLVDAYIDHFTGRGRWFFRRWLARADRYMPMMRPILASHGLPADTVYLAMIESGFSSRATSTAQASGYWQFIRSTGQIFGLEQSTWVDERRDFVLATHAAARYLQQLYHRFDDWHLAWAGYNAGGGRVSRALAKTGASNFWELLSHPQSLARETRHYVPKLIAAAIVAKNREAYGFSDVEGLDPLAYDEVDVDGATDLHFSAQATGASMETLRALNPALLYDVTPPRQKYRLRVPAGMGASLTTALTKLPRRERFAYQQHNVRSGETLSGIARRYGSTVRAICDFNGIQDPRLIHPGRRLVVPARGPGSPTPGRALVRRARREEGAAEATRRTGSRRHVVSRGETLWSISRRYGVTVAHLKRRNGRRGDSLGVGDVLEIF